MSELLADRNLLFGILAERLNFITRDVLIQAFRCWVSVETKPLGQILLEQNALSLEEMELLEVLTRKHLERHDNDPIKCLASLALDLAFLAEVVKIDPELANSLTLLDLPSTVERPEGMAHFDLSPPSVLLGHRFQILRPYAEGGLGRIFVALDRELNREVALKLIKDEGAGARSQKRFLFEAEVTGGLEHPGIVPVHGLGRYEDGRPYYAMRLIRGQTLRDVVQNFHQQDDAFPAEGERALELRRLLGCVIAVCNAVAYAHSQGVLHRDLKPGNIMLGKYGETLVVDWGVAKALNRPDDIPADEAENSLRASSEGSLAATVPGTPVGTPQYMSPEQAAGDLDRIGPAADVYSLGATLYSVLTGKAPFSREEASEAVLERVKAGDFPPPRQVLPNVHPALEAITLKAMAMKPEDRYASPLDLARDLEQWLADEPVEVYHDPPLTQAGRWLRRHKPLAAGVGALLVSAVIGLIARDAQMLRQNQRVKQERDIANRARIIAEQSQVNEVRARQEADASLQTASEAVDSLLSRVSDVRMAYIPQMEPLRKELGNEALRLSEFLLRQRPENPDVRNSTAMTYRRVGHIHGLMGEYDRCFECYGRALELYASLVTRYPKILVVRDLMAEAELEFADALRLGGRIDDALKHCRNAVLIAEQLRVEAPNESDYQRTHARSLFSLALSLLDFSEVPEARASCRTAVTLLKDLNTRTPRFHLDPILLAIALVHQGIAERAGNNPKNAGAALRSATTLLRELLAREPKNSDAEFFLAWARNQQATLAAADASQRASAEAVFSEAIERLSRLQRDFPRISNYRMELAFAFVGRAGVRVESGKAHHAKAQDDCEQAQALLKTLAKESPRTPDLAGLDAEALATRARIALARGERGEARQLLEQAITRQKVALKANPRNVPDQERLARLSAECRQVE
ncbi:MAG: hypothetical protein NVSMB9_15060 [Isosphaeraceae bacterium]